MIKEKKIAVICHSQHHLKKAEVLKKNFNSYVESFLLQSGKTISMDTSQEIILNSVFTSQYNIFIFFALQPTKRNIELLQQIRKSGGILIAFQESNQLEMHEGDVHNLLLQADLVIAASSQEKDIMINDFNMSAKHIVSFGWLFHPNKKLQEIPSSRLQKLIAKEQILLVLSAPDNITVSSYETYTIRKSIITALLSEYSDSKLIIRPHPLEDLEELQSFVRQVSSKDECIIITSEGDFTNAIENSRYIFLSNRTQSAVELMHSNKLTLYLLGKENFLTKHALQYHEVRKINDMEFLPLTGEQCIRFFEKKYFHAENNFEEVENLILNTGHACEADDYQNEILLWQYVNFSLHEKIFLSKISGSIKDLIQKILNDPAKITVNELELPNKNCSISTAIFIIYLRKILSDKKPQAILIEDICSSFMTRWFVQYYPLDALQFFYYLKRHALERGLENSVIALIYRANDVLKTKSLMFRILTNCNVLLVSNSNIKILFFLQKILNLFWLAAKRV